MPGPPPKPAGQRRRRNLPTVPTERLPADGRSGPVPPWPLSAPADDELSLWESLWQSPQATVWERTGVARTVARYVRTVTRAESPEATGAILSEARRLEESLGLSPAALLRLRWEIVDGPDQIDGPVELDEVARMRKAEEIRRRAIIGADPEERARFEERMGRRAFADPQPGKR